MKILLGRYRRLAIVLIISLAMSGCSSGSKNKNRTPPPPPPPSADATLASLSVGNLVLVPTFDPAVMNYTAGAVYRPDSADVAATTTNAAATYQVNGGSISTVALPLGASNIAVDVTAQDGTSMRTYTVTVTRANFAQQAYVKASNSQTLDWFGDGSITLSSDGNTMAAGAIGESSAASGIDGDQTDNTQTDSGAVYVFTRDSARAWSQQAYVKASNTALEDQFGGVTALSADGNTLVVAANQEDSDATGVNGNQGNNNAAGSGAAYVFARNGAGAWTQQAYIKASNTSATDAFASQLSLSGDGNTLAVATEFEDSDAVGIDGDQSDNSAAGAGAVYVFMRDGGGTWSQQAYVKASNTDADDKFGAAVALSDDGNTLAVGAYGEDSRAIGVGGNESDNSFTVCGAVYVYTRDSMGVWTQQAYVKASNTESGDAFGWDVSLSADGDTLAVGASFEDGGTSGVNGDQANNGATSSGAVYVFTRDTGGVWTQQAYVKASNTDAADSFGHDVALSADGNLMAVSATAEDSDATGINGDQANNNLSGSGAVYQFVRNGGGVWTQEFYVKGSATNVDDAFGQGVALSADGATLTVEAYLEDSRATGIGGDDTDNNANDAGAAYVYQ